MYNVGTHGSHFVIDFCEQSPPNKMLPDLLKWYLNGISIFCQKAIQLRVGFC